MADAESLSYRTIRNSDESITVEWLGPSKYSAGDISAAETYADDHSALREAMYVLYSLLADGGVPANELIQQAKTNGISKRTLMRAKKELRVESAKKGSGLGSRWFWHLADDEDLIRPLKEKDIGELIDRMIYGDDDLAPPQFRQKRSGNAARPDQDHPGDNGDGGCSIR